MRPVQRRSSRPSPITFALALLAMASLIGGTWLVVTRAHRARSAASSSARAQVEVPPNESPVAAHAETPEPPAPLPPPVLARAAPVAVAPSEPDAAAADDQPAAPSPPPGLTRPGALISNHNRRLEEADEQVFATGQLPDSTQAAIRRINLAYRTQTELRGGSAAAEESGSAGVAASAVRSRQDALRLLLGDQPAREFDAQERGAVRRLRGKYRFEWGRQLHE